MNFSNLKNESNGDLELELEDAAFFGPTNGTANARAIISQVAAAAGLTVTIQ